jgi:uncharacterized phage protein gp47/JayE
MPWFTPTLKAVRIQVRDLVRSRAKDADASIPNSVLRVVADITAAMCHKALQYLDWLRTQLLPDTAEDEWLNRHGRMWLTNADGSRGKKMATLASGQIVLSGQTWAPVGIGARFRSARNSIEYETTEQVFLAAGGAATPAPARALDPGAAGNLEPGEILVPISPVEGLSGEAFVTSMDGGVDEETNEELRGRLLLRIRQPPAGGSNIDYVHWALAVPGVTRAWCSSLEMGMGTVTVRVMMDNLRADEHGFPRQSDLDRVWNYLDTVRPVAVKDMWVVAPIRQRVDIIVRRLTPDTPAVRAAIGDSLAAMLKERAEPGGAIYAAWKNFAIMNAPGVVSYALGNPNDDVMPSPGHMPVLGNISYGD